MLIFSGSLFQVARFWEGLEGGTQNRELVNHLYEMTRYELEHRNRKKLILGSNTSPSKRQASIPQGSSQESTSEQISPFAHVRHWNKGARRNQIKKGGIVVQGHHLHSLLHSILSCQQQLISWWTHQEIFKPILSPNTSFHQTTTLISSWITEVQ